MSRLRHDESRGHEGQQTPSSCQPARDLGSWLSQPGDGGSISTWGRAIHLGSESQQAILGARLQVRLSHPDTAFGEMVSIGWDRNGWPRQFSELGHPHQWSEPSIHIDSTDGMPRKSWCFLEFIAAMEGTKDKTALFRPETTSAHTRHVPVTIPPTRRAELVFRLVSERGHAKCIPGLRWNVADLASRRRWPPDKSGRRRKTSISKSQGAILSCYQYWLLGLGLVLLFQPRHQNFGFRVGSLGPTRL
jgi:hypothetical protein